jgi:hypothetical protein
MWKWLEDNKIVESIADKWRATDAARALLAHLETENTRQLLKTATGGRSQANPIAFPLHSA